MNRKIQRLAFGLMIAGAFTGGFSSCGSGSKVGNEQTEQKGPGGPRLGEKPKGGPVIDKSGDAELQSLVREVVPRFRQAEYTDAQTGAKIPYNLLMPTEIKEGERYPLLLFMADASTPGDDVQLPLTQGYGALVWGTEQWQKEHPCFVLVPQFSGVAVNDAYEHTDEVDAVARLVRECTAHYPVDTDRIYTTGQSMGGMISMYFNVAYPDLFAASIFVDSHWEPKTFPALARHKFVWFIAGDSGKAFAEMKPFLKVANEEKVKYAFAEWSARLPEAEQDRLADAMFAKDAPVNLIEFTPKSVLPSDGKGSEHMYSFDYAYKVKAVREWLFRQKK